MNKVRLIQATEVLFMIIFMLAGILCLFSGVILMALFGVLTVVTTVMWFHAVFIKPKYDSDK